MNLSLDERQYSPDLQRRLAETTRFTKSFEQAAALARVWAEVTLSSRQVGRIVEAIGAELVERRDAEVEDFVHHRRGPEGPDPGHELVVVFADGGRVQTRDDTAGQGPGVHDPHWREDKVARLQTMSSACHAVDPCPEPPACFLDLQKLEQFLDPEKVQENQVSASPTAADAASPTAADAEIGRAHV